MEENRTADLTTDEERPLPEKRYTRDEAAAFLQEIARRLVSSDDAALHSMLALNQILRSPGITEVLDEDLKEQARDLWLKVKSTGIHVNDPPLLYGLPDFAPEDDEPETEIVDGA